MFMFSNALGSEQGVILDRASECFFQSDEQTRAETTDLQQTESLWGSYCSVSCWVCARELLIQLYSLTDGCTKLHDIVQMLLFVSDSCIREKKSVPFPSTQPTCFPEPRVDFFSSSRPVLGADSEVIHTDGKTVTVTKPTVCPLSVWWDSEEISRDTWRIFLHFDKERTPRSTYREMKVTGGFFFAAVWQYREKILILHYGCPECEGGRQAEAVHLPHVISPTVTALWGSFVGVMHFGTVAEKTKS